ncbi:MAG TPA: hypothetical protein VGG62_17710 [Terracidiphilus sp.]|jgi:hypothetical protein
MPYNLKPAVVAAGAVFPQSLSTSFAETHLYPLVTISYNDGTFERSLIQDGTNAPRALRTWTLAKRLNTAQLASLRTFFETTAQGGLNPFYFYDPFGVAPGQKTGSNFTADGSNTQGRATCFFRGSWSERSDLGRHTVGNLMLVEVA